MTSLIPYISEESNFYIEYKNWARLLGYAKAAQEEYQSEISGMLILSECKDGDYTLSHPTILKQSISASKTSLDKEALASYYTSAFKKHGKNVKFVWWHSHGLMEAFMSHIDEKTIQEYASGDWSLSLVINVYGSYELRLQIYKPLNFAVRTNLDILNHPLNKPASQSIMDEVKEKIVKSKYAVTPYKPGAEPRTTFLNERACGVKEELGLAFAPRVYTFVANALAEYRDRKINYNKLRHILSDLDAFSSYFNYFVDCPPPTELDDLIEREKNPAGLLIFKVSDDWE